MGAKVRGALTRISPFFWIAAALAIARTATDGHLPDLGEIILFSSIGMSRDIAAAIAGQDRRERVLLAEALAASSRGEDGQEDGPPSHLRAL